MSPPGCHTLPDGRILSFDLAVSRLSSLESGPVVLLSNSLAAPYQSWDQVTKVLLTSGYNVLRYDQPGHGKSTAPTNLESTSFDSMADDVFSLLHHLSIKVLAAWVGVSMGAAKGVFFSTKYPGRVRNLIICDTISSSPAVAGVPDVFGPRATQALEERDMNSQVDGTLERWFSPQWRMSNPDRTKEMRDIMMSTTVEGFVTCIRALQARSFDLKPLTGKLGDSVDSVLLVVGELDGNLPQTMNELRDQIQQGFQTAQKPGTVELKVINGAGHVCYVDGFNEFCEVVKGQLGGAAR